jgi:hypothetical protein
MALLLGAGASCGIAIWEVVFGDLMVAYIKSNQIEPVTRKLLLLFGGVGLAVPLIAIALYWWTHRTRPLDAARKIESLAWKLSPLCLSIVVPTLPSQRRSCSIGHSSSRPSSVRPPGPLLRSANARKTLLIAGLRGSPGSS